MHSKVSSVYQHQQLSTTTEIGSTPYRNEVSVYVVRYKLYKSLQTNGKMHSIRNETDDDD